MREPQTRTIDGRVFEVTPLPAGLAVKALARLSNALGPALENINSFAAVEGAVLDAMATLLSRLDGDNLEVLCKIFATCSRAEKSPGAGEMIALAPTFDVYFSGDLGTLAEWFTFCVEVNYAGFFRVVRDRLGQRVVSVATAKSSSTSPPGSSGTSTASQ